MAQRNKKLIYHIYWGTAGNAGLYLDEIYKTLEKYGYSQKAFVNYYYPFDYGEKVFFKYTEMGHCKIKRFRGYFRFLELLWAILRIFIRTIIDRPAIINYSLVGSFAIVRWYLVLAKKITGAKIVLTCHDILPSQSSLQGASSELRNRKKIFKSVDYYLVHNRLSEIQLKEIFMIEETRIVRHLFPIMDLSKLVDIKNTDLRKSDFLFIGHLRREKGVDVLLEAWDIFHQDYPNALLRIAGNLPKMENLYIEKYKDRDDVDFMLKFLSDDEYCSLIESTLYVVLPYKHGTNSGVVSTVLALGANVIASDIPMFEQNPLLSKKSLFETENPSSLAKVMEYAMNNARTDEKNDLGLREYRQRFEKEVEEVYSTLLN